MEQVSKVAIVDCIRKRDARKMERGRGGMYEGGGGRGALEMGGARIDLLWTRRDNLKMYLVPYSTCTWPGCFYCITVQLYVLSRLKECL